MYRVKLICAGVPEGEGSEGALEIGNEFAHQRTWWQNVQCRWDGTRLVLEAESDFDSDGMALSHEFSDCVSAFIEGTFGYSVMVESVTKVEDL